jgi:NADH-quinone oxidoreductase subunit I
MWGSGLLNGLRITMRNMMRGPITVQYPYELLDLPERARWAVEPILDEDGQHKCTACLNCVKVCPDHILDLDVTTAEDKSKHINSFSYELGACMMCGLCVEACPFSAIKMGQDYELAVTDVDELVTMLLEDTPAVSARKNREDRPRPERKPKPAAEEKAEPAEKPAADDAAESKAEPAEKPADAPEAPQADGEGAEDA